VNYLLHLAIVIAIYTILAESLNLAAGYGGMLSLAHAAFFATGAYSVAILMTRLQMQFFTSVLIGMCVAGGLALFVGWVALRFRGDFFILVTLGFQAIIYTLLHNWLTLTGGPYGISGIPRPNVLGVSMVNLWAFAGLAAIVAAGIAAIHGRLVHCPFGRTLQAVRDDELAATSVGKNALLVKASAFIVSGALASVAGALFASYYGYVDPTTFTLEESVFIFAVVVVGGIGNLKGPVIGAMIMVLLPEILRFLQIPDTVAASIRQVLYGALLVLMMFFRPQGVAGRYSFE
jgi:branched-chain amino acid transport system permease protein